MKNKKDEVNQNTLSVNDAYSAFVQLVLQAEAVTWNRFYNYLMAMTFLVLAWATLYVQLSITPHTKLILASICVLGITCGLLWGALGYRGRKFLDEYAKAGSALEKNAAYWPKELENFRPLTISRDKRDELPFRFSGSIFLLTGVPLLLSVLYVVLLCASINREKNQLERWQRTHNKRNHDAHSFGKTMLKLSSTDSCIRSTVFAAEEIDRFVAAKTAAWLRQTFRRHALSTTCLAASERGAGFALCSTNACALRARRRTSGSTAIRAFASTSQTTLVFARTACFPRHVIRHWQPPRKLKLKGFTV